MDAHLTKVSNLAISFITVVHRRDYVKDGGRQPPPLEITLTAPTLVSISDIHSNEQNRG